MSYRWRERHRERNTGGRERERVRERDGREERTGMNKNFIFILYNFNERILYNNGTMLNTVLRARSVDNNYLYLAL